MASSACQGPLRRDALLDDVVARLERELRLRQDQLQEEAARNARAKAQLDMLHSLSLASTAVHTLISAEAAGGADAVRAAAGAPAVAELERQLATLMAALDTDAAAAGGGGGGESGGGGGGVESGGGGGGGGGGGESGAEAGASRLSGSASGAGAGDAPAPAGAGAGGAAVVADGDEASSGSAPGASSGAAPARRRRGGGAAAAGAGGAAAEAGGPPGVVSMRVSDFLCDIVAGRAQIGTKSEFISFWRQKVMQLAMLAHHYRIGAVQREAIEKVMCEMGIRFGSLFLFGSYALEVIVLDMDTGEACEASESLWDGVAASLALSPDQAMMFGLLHRWWKSTTQTYNRERQDLAQQALAAPTDLELQEAAASGLERINSAYLSAAVAVLVVTMFGVTRPEQVASSWISCWPRMPLMTAIFEALERQRSI